MGYAGSSGGYSGGSSCGMIAAASWSGVIAARARIAALRGQAEQVADSLDQLESATRAMESIEYVALGLGSAALARAGLGQVEAASALLVEVGETAGVRESEFCSVFLPSMTRIAIALESRDLAERLVIGFVPRWVYAEHALAAANAALAEARGDLQAGADAYADAADRWERFGVVPEQAFAFLGQGRCLLGLSRSSEASPVLHRAREIFERLRAAPAREETDMLLERATAMTS